MSDDIINYDEMVQVALIGVVRDILIDTKKNGLPGENHFYITFQTTHPDVKIPPYLRERYEEDMTIVMQNQFWDLLIDDEHFEISLSFNRNKEHLSVPFEALLGFFDPSVDFGLHFNSDLETTIEFAETEVIGASTTKKVQDSAVKDNTKKDNIVTLDAFRKKK